MKYFKKIEGEKVYLSPINQEDLLDYVSFMNDKNVTDNLGNTFLLTTIDAEKEWLAKEKENEMRFAIILKEGDILLGNCSMFHIDRINRTCTFGIFIGKYDKRGKGYGTEALKLLLDYAFKIQNMHSIDLEVYSFNEAAIKCYEKLGFKKCGIRHEAYYVNGRYHDIITMEIFKCDVLK